MDVVVVRARERETDEDACALGPGGQLYDETLEHPSRASAVAGLEVVVAGVSGSAAGILRTVGRGQAGGLLGEFGCHPRRAARSRFACCLLERGGNGGIGPGRGEREVARPLLRIEDDLRQAPVEFAVARGAAVGGRGEEWMGEADAIALEFDDLRLDGWLEHAPVAASRSRDKRQRWLG
jgi:hypothetical protein